MLFCSYMAKEVFGMLGKSCRLLYHLNFMLWWITRPLFSVYLTGTYPPVPTLKCTYGMTSALPGSLSWEESKMEGTQCKKRKPLFTCTTWAPKFNILSWMLSRVLEIPFPIHCSLHSPLLEIMDVSLDELRALLLAFSIILIDLTNKEG